MSTSLADQLQVWGIENDTVIYSDGSLGAVFSAQPTDISFLPSDEINGLSVRLRTFLNALPEGTDVQFLKEVTPTPEEELKCQIGDSLPGTCQSLTDALNTERVNLYQTMNKDGLLVRHQILILVRRPLGRALVKGLKFFNRPSKFSSFANGEFEREYAAFEKILGTISESISSVGTPLKRMTGREIAEKIYRQWNPDRPANLGSYDSDDLRHSLIFTDAVIGGQGFALGSIHHRVISLKLLPDQTYAGMAQLLNDLPFGSQTYLSIYVPEQTKEMESLQTQRRLAFSLANARPGRARDIDIEAKFADLETILEELVQGGEKIFRVSLNIILSGPSLDALDSQVSLCLANLRDLSGAEGLVETVAAFGVFSEVCFPNCRAGERQRRLKTSNLADFLPIYGPWAGHKEAPAIFRSRAGSLFGFDPFASELTNANQLISGASGSGKSYLTNKLLLQFLNGDPKIFIIDIGGSYKKLTETLGGQYVPLGVGADLALCPFDLSPGELTPSEQKIKFLVGLLETMTKEDGEARLPRLERAELEDAVQRVYERDGSPSLSGLRDILLGHDSGSMRRMGKILGQWTGDSPYGKFVDRETNIKLDRSLICFDLKGLETHPDLQAACLFIITDLIWRVVQQDRGTKKYLILDECWKILESPAGAALVGDVFRTFRKYYASAIAISQTIDDFARSPVAHAIIPNSSVKWLLKQRGSNKQNLKEILSLNDSELEVVDSLRQERGLFSEAFLMAGEGRSVVLVESTPLEYWIATTDPRDLAAIDDLRVKRTDLQTIDVLKHLAELYPAGIAANSR